MRVLIWFNVQLGGLKGGERALSRLPKDLNKREKIFTCQTIFLQPDFHSKN
jgi:hypothetical protein